MKKLDETTELTRREYFFYWLQLRRGKEKARKGVIRTELRFFLQKVIYTLIKTKFDCENNILSFTCYCSC